MYILVDVNENMLRGVHTESCELSDKQVDNGLAEFEIVIANEIEKRTVYDLTIYDLYYISVVYYQHYKEQLNIEYFMKSWVVLDIKQWNNHE